MPTAIRRVASRVNNLARDRRQRGSRHRDYDAIRFTQRSDRLQGQPMSAYRPCRPAGIPPAVYAANLRLLDLNVLVPSNQIPLVPARFAAITAAIRAGHALDAIAVRPLPDGRYLIVGGHHRVAASRNLGLTHIPAIVEVLLG